MRNLELKYLGIPWENKHIQFPELQLSSPRLLIFRCYPSAPYDSQHFFSENVFFKTSLQGRLHSDSPSSLYFSMRFHVCILCAWIWRVAFVLPKSQGSSRLEQELTQASTCYHFWLVGEIAQEHNYTSAWF